MSLFVVSLSLLAQRSCVHSTHICCLKMLCLLLCKRDVEHLEQQLYQIVKGDHSAAEGYRVQGLGG